LAPEPNAIKPKFLLLKTLCRSSEHHETSAGL